MRIRLYFFPQEISIEFIKNEFGIYGSLEKIEIFHDKFNKTKFAHVTFKENLAAYCALIDCKPQQKSKNIEILRPADAHLQPDNPVDSSSSPFYNLPDDCLLAIFKYCDFYVLAMLSTVCNKMCEILRDRVFNKISKFNSVPTNDAEVTKGLLAVSRLVQCKNPANFYLKVCRNAQSHFGWPAISLDMMASKSEIFVETDFFKSNWLNELEKVAKRIKSIHLHWSIYDASKVTFDSKFVFPNSTKLVITSYAMDSYISGLLSVVDIMPKLEAITIREGFVHWNDIISCCGKARNLRSFAIENCRFDCDVRKQDIIEIAGQIKGSNNHFPLCLQFSRISYAYEYGGDYSSTTTLTTKINFEANKLVLHISILSTFSKKS